MIGRVSEREWLGRMLSEPGSVCQLVGPPGIGKSAIARAYLSEREDVLWLSLETVAEGTLLPALAAALDVPAHENAVTAAVADFALLVVDGAERHVEELADRIVGWRAVPIPTRVLVTTQRRVPVAPNAPALEVGPLPLEDAVALFVQRAHAVSANRFVSEPADIERLVERVDRWPLAIELAASRVRLYSPGELLAEDPLEVLEDPRRGGRHASLHEALSAALAQLPDEDHLALCRVALVQGRFSREAFVEITGSGLATLESLLDASLVRWEYDGSTRRYAMLASVREFARDRLPADDPARARYAEAVLRRAREARASLWGPDAREGYLQLRTLQNDLVPLLGAPPAVAGEAALALGTLALAYGPVDTALTWVRGVDRAALPEDLADELLHLEAELLVHLHQSADAFQVLEGAGEAVRTLLLRARALRASDPERATALNEAAVRAADSDGTDIERVLGRLNLGVSLRHAGRLDEAIRVWKEGRELARRGRFPRAEGAIEANLAVAIAFRDGHDDRTREQLQRALKLARATGVYRLTIHLQVLLAEADVETNHPGAPDAVDATVELARRNGDTAWLQSARLLEAFMAVEHGDSDRYHAVRQWFDGAHTADAERGLHPLPAAHDRAMLAYLEARWRVEHGDISGAEAQLETAQQQLGDARLTTDELLVKLALAALRGDPPPEIGPAFGPGSPLHVSAGLVAAAAAGETLPPDLVDAAQHSLDARFTLAFIRATERVEVARDGTWFVGADGERVDLGRKRVLRRVLEGFAANEGRWLTLQEVLELGWPGENPAGDSGRSRVHVAVSELRRMGLRDALVSGNVPDAAYMLVAVVKD